MEKLEVTDQEREALRALARRRWARRTPEERSEHARRMAQARWGSSGEQGSPDRDE